jgi:hypothetical protein
MTAVCDGGACPSNALLRRRVPAEEDQMARKYSRGAEKEVKNEMHRYKQGKAKSGRSGKGGKVKSRKQAIAIGLSKARKKGKKVPRKKKKS